MLNTEETATTPIPTKVVRRGRPKMKVVEGDETTPTPEKKSSKAILFSFKNNNKKGLDYLIRYNKQTGHSFNTLLNRIVELAAKEDALRGNIDLYVPRSVEKARELLAQFERSRKG